eukprot:5210511-Pyramimonas_sp.AAC.1
MRGRWPLSRAEGVQPRSGAQPPSKLWTDNLMGLEARLRGGGSKDRQAVRWRAARPAPRLGQRRRRRPLASLAARQEAGARARAAGRRVAKLEAGRQGVGAQKRQGLRGRQLPR